MAYQFLFYNNVNTTLAASINASATTIQLSSVTNLPASIPAGCAIPFTLNDAATGNVYEELYATAISGNTLTVIRGQGGTTATSWVIGDYAFCGPTGDTVQRKIPFRKVIETLLPYGSTPFGLTTVGDFQSVPNFSKTIAQSGIFAISINESIDLTLPIFLRLDYTTDIAGGNVYIQLGYQGFASNAALGTASYTNNDEAIPAPATAGNLVVTNTAIAIIPAATILTAKEINCVITRLSTNGLDTNTGNFQLINITLGQ